MDDYSFDIEHCNLCDISIGCFFKPGKGRGCRNSIMYITSHYTSGDYKKGIMYGKSTKIIRDFNDSYNLNAYYTSLVKCTSKGNPTDFEINNCIEHLKLEIFRIKPKIIIPIGDIVTSNFLDYNYFKNVVDKANIKIINDIETIIYPIYNPSYKGGDIKVIYDKSFKNIAKMYINFINKNHFSFKLYTSD